MKLVYLSAALMLASSVAAQARTAGSGTLKTETRKVAAISAVDLAGIGTVTLIQGDTESLEVEAEDNILPLLETTVEKGTLHIGLKGDAAPTKPVRLKLMVKTLDRVQLSGSGTIRAEKFVASGALEARLIGSGLIDLKGLECVNWNVAIVGSGDVKAAGRAKEQKIDVTGSGDYEAFGLETETAEITVSGSGDCEINAKSQLNATISGSGDVDYLGSPTVTKKVTGSGGVHPQAKSQG